MYSNILFCYVLTYPIIPRRITSYSSLFEYAQLKPFLFYCELFWAVLFYSSLVCLLYWIMFRTRSLPCDRLLQKPRTCWSRSSPRASELQAC